MTVRERENGGLERLTSRLAYGSCTTTLSPAKGTLCLRSQAPKPPHSVLRGLGLWFRLHSSLSQGT